MKTKIISVILGILLISNILLASAVSIKDVVSYPEEVEPGEVFDVSIEIKNTHDFDIKNINVKLILTKESEPTNPFDPTAAPTQGEDLPFAPYQSSSEKFLEELESNEEENFKFKLIVLPETSSGVYKVPVEITYEDGNGRNYSKKGLISIIVNSIPELKVSLEDSIVLIKGKENTFSIKLINSGLANVKFVYVKANEVSGLRFVSEKEQYLGDIDSDDFDSIEYTVYIEKDALNSIRLPLVLKFRDSTNKQFTQTKSIILKAYSLEEARELGLVEKPDYKIPGGIGLVIFLYIIYLIRKKRRLKKLRGR